MGLSNSCPLHHEVYFQKHFKAFHAWCCAGGTGTGAGVGNGAGAGVGVGVGAGAAGAAGGAAGAAGGVAGGTTGGAAGGAAGGACQEAFTAVALVGEAAALGRRLAFASKWNAFL